MSFLIGCQRVFAGREVTILQSYQICYIKSLHFIAHFFLLSGNVA